MDSSRASNTKKGVLIGTVRPSRARRILLFVFRRCRTNLIEISRFPGLPSHVFPRDILILCAELGVSMFIRGRTLLFNDGNADQGVIVLLFWNNDRRAWCLLYYL